MILSTFLNFFAAKRYKKLKRDKIEHHFSYRCQTKCCYVVDDKAFISTKRAKMNSAMEIVIFRNAG